jgi:hypothetical protein
MCKVWSVVNDDIPDAFRFAIWVDVNAVRTLYWFCVRYDGLLFNMIGIWFNINPDNCVTYNI